MTTAVRLSDWLPDHNDPSAAPLAEQLRQRTDPAAEIEQRIAAARAEGYAAGCAETADRLRADAQDLAAALVSSMTAVSDAAAAAAAETVRADATDLAEAAWQLARWAVGRELSADPTTLTGAVAAALGDVDATATATVYTHPDTIAQLRAWASAHTPHRLDLAADPQLEPGEIRVLTDTGARIEATVTEIGRRALARLVGTVAATEPEPGTA